MVKIISGNWKMNGSRKEIKKWFQNFFKKVELFEKINRKEVPDILLCVPSLYLSFAKQVAAGHNKDTEQFKIIIGAQDCHYETSGSFTGNLSPLMLREFDIDHTIVGHSERRLFEHETDELVAKKARACIENDITPIICVGEPLSIRETGKHLEFLAKQVFDSTENVDITRAIIAYEPIWAIGTGKIPTLDEIEETNGYLKKVLSKKSSIPSNEITILYGGSVKASNSKEISNLESVDGMLVGGASLKGDEFFDIVAKGMQA
ncbi:MAG: triose-phosphate isomerase [Rickettsiales bacterium]|jgi:triosephosphate isomerase|nr:triose-phosphate isomerase [Rickettsiales bacterium]